jgi:hypothetical protein
MANVVRIKRHLDSETVHLPELKELVGHDVEIVVRELTSNGPYLKGEDYPALVEIWDNDDDSIFDEL